MIKNFFVLLLISVSFLFLSCGEKKTESPLDQLTDKAKEMENLGEKMKEASRDLQKGKKLIRLILEN